MAAVGLCSDSPDEEGGPQMPREIVNSTAFRFVRSFSLIVLFAGFVPLSVSGAVYVVNTTADTQDLTVTDGICVDAAGSCSLRAAITQSNATAELDVIIVPAGTYTLTLVAPNENANAGGDLDITSPVSIEGAGIGITIVQANLLPNAATERVFHITGTASPNGFNIVEAAGNSHHVSLSGLTIRNGNNTSNTFGGGVRIDNPALELRILNSSISNNRAASCGGGIHVGANGGKVIITGSTFANNSSGSQVPQTGSAGGGIYIDSTAEVEISNSTITGNSASSSLANPLGGGIFNARGEVAISNSTISGNTASSTSSSFRGSGGGIWNETGNLTIRDSTITSNTANVYGGASNLARTLPSTLAIVNSTVSNNTVTGTQQASPQGGGVYNGTVSSGTATVNIDRSTVNNNTAPNGFAGGLYNLGMGGGPVNMNITHSTVANNSAPDAAGIYNAGPNARALIDFSTFSGNTAQGNGGNIYTDTGAVTIIGNSISANGVSNVGPNIFTFGSGTYQSQGFNRFESIAGSTFPPQGTDVVGIDPGLGPLADNGGPTHTFLPGPNSNVLNVIPNGTNGCGTTNAFDQRLFPRPGGNACDVGAVEVQPEVPWVGLTPPFLYIGPDAGESRDTKVFEPNGTLTSGDINPFGRGFAGGVTVAVGDVNGDGIPDLITSQATGGSRVKVFDGANGNLLHDFEPFSQGFTGGVYVAAGDLNDDGIDDVVVGSGAGGGPHVKVFSGLNGSELRSFFAYDTGFLGGVRVAAGDVNGDGRDDIITGAGPGGGPHVKVFNGQTGDQLDSFFAFQGFSGGVFVAAGDVTGDGRADIITGADAGGGPHVKVFSGASSTIILHDFFGYEGSFTGGVRVAAGDVNGDGSADIITGPGNGAAPHVKIFSGSTGTELSSFFAYSSTTNGPDFNGGIYVSGGLLKSEPSAGPFQVSGQVFTSDDRGLRSAKVSIRDDQGNIKSVLTSSLGFFVFDDVEPGKTYVVSVVSKRFRFNQQTIHVAGNVDTITFTGLE